MKPFTRNLIFFVLLNFICISLMYSQVPAITPIQGPVVVCLPATSAINYSVTATNGPISYSWTYAGPANMVTINNPAASLTAISFPSQYYNTTFTLYCYASNGSGNSSVVSFAVNVFETPSVTFSGAHSFCQGSSTNLSASPTIFQASSTTISYNWSPSIGLSSTNTATVTANPPTSTNYTVLLTNGACTNTNYFNVIVNPLPTLVASAVPSVICAGQTSNLTLGGNANSYSLNSTPIPFTAVLSPSITTPYTVTSSDQNGCHSVPVILTLSVNPLPVISSVFNPPAICIGDTSKLVLSGSAISYTVNGNPSTSTLVLTPVTTTSYYISGTAANGCQSMPQQVVLPVNPLPAVSVSSSYTSICKGESTSLFFTGTSTSYSLNSVASPPTVIVSPTAPTIYTVTGKDANGCKNLVTYALIVNGCVGLNEHSDEKLNFEIFPNPNDGTFSVRSIKEETVYLTSELGQTIQVISLAPGFSAEISGLVPGIYFVIGSSVKKKIVVTR